MENTWKIHTSDVATPDLHDSEVFQNATKRCYATSRQSRWMQDLAQQPQETALRGSRQ